MSSGHEARLKKVEAALQPPPAAPGIALCWDNHGGRGVEPVPCEYNGAWVERSEVPPDALIIVLIRDAPGVEPVAGV